MKKLSESLIFLNLIVFIFVCIPAYFYQEYGLLFFSVDCLVLLSAVIIYTLLLRLRELNG